MPKTNWKPIRRHNRFPSRCDGSFCRMGTVLTSSGIIEPQTIPHGLPSPIFPECFGSVGTQSRLQCGASKGDEAGDLCGQ
jgi:hypothetical protein